MNILNKLRKPSLSIILSSFVLLYSCSQGDNNLLEPELVDNSETIAKLINSYDETIKTINLSNELSNEDIGNIFIKEAIEQGLTLGYINSRSNNNNDYEQSSSEYKQFSLKLIDASSFASKEEQKPSI